MGFSSRRCHKCIAIESEYLRISEYLHGKSILFARVDVDEVRSLSAKYGVTSLPSLVFFHKRRPYPYKGAQTLEAIQSYVQKITSSPVQSLDSVEETETFIALERSAALHMHSFNVVAFFREAKGMEEEDYEEFVEIARRLQFTPDIYFAVVTKPLVSQRFIATRVIDRTPSLLLSGEGLQRAINIDELDADTGMQRWIETMSIPLVAKMDEQNFLIYERLGLPMLLMFLDLSEEHLTKSPGVVGGQSGGVLNEVLIQELRDTAREHVGRLSFVYLGKLSPHYLPSLMRIRRQHVRG